MKPTIRLISFLFLAGPIVACGPGSSSDDDTNMSTYTETAELTAQIEPTQSQIKVMSIVDEKEPSNPLFPCSITIETNPTSTPIKIFNYQITSDGTTLVLDEERLERIAELDENVEVDGVATELFAVWAFPPRRNEGILNEVTVTIRRDQMNLKNTCRQ